MKSDVMNITSWILLEQAEDAPDWGFPDRSGGVLWISKNRQIEFAFPSGFEVQEPFICILSLPRTKTDSPKSLGVAIHMVVDALRKDNQKIRLWCHYGGNINPALAGTIWRHWPRLQTECKVKLTEVAADPGFPLPFSKGQKNLPCYSDFERLRKDIRSGISYAAAAHKLQGLWQRTRDALNVEAQLQSIVKAGNFGISARRLQEIISFEGDQKSSVSTALTALHFYQSFGFDSLIKPSFPSPIHIFF